MTIYETGLVDHGSKDLTRSDPVLRRIVSAIEPPQIYSTGSVFHDLMSCLVEQQIHYRSTKKVFSRLLHRAEIELLTPENFAYFEEAALSSVKLSATRTEAIVNFHEFSIHDKSQWAKMPDEEIRSVLGSIKGIGNWSVDMVLLYTLGRPDIFPADDHHLKIIMTEEYGLDPRSRLRKQMLETAEAWKGNRSLAVLYLLAWKKLKKELQI